MKVDVIHANLDHNVDDTEKQLMGIGSLIKEMSGKDIYVVHSTHCINVSILYSGNNDVNCISEKVLNSCE
jgi:hypothetical protein